MGDEKNQIIILLYSKMSTTLFSQNIDYFVSIEWVRYRGKWIPKSLFFAPTYRERIDRCIRLETESLLEFSYEDVIRSQNLSPFPWWNSGTYCETHTVHVQDMEKFLKQDFFNLLNDGEWPLTIAAKDFATFIYLEPLLPCNVILTESTDDVQTLVLKYGQWNRGEIV